MQSEMKLFGGFDTVALKQHFGKKIMELEDEKRAVQVKLKLWSYYYWLEITATYLFNSQTYAARKGLFVI